MKLLIRRSQPLYATGLRLFGGVALSLLTSPLAYAVPTPPSRMPEALSPSRIRVRVAEAAPSVRVRGESMRVFEASGATGSGPEGAGRWELHCQDGRIRARSPDRGETISLREPVVIRAAGAGAIAMGDHVYRQELRVHSVGSFCEVVNYVEVDKYLGGLVNSEFSSKWSDAAIGAQIVAARTYALYQMRMARLDPDRHFDVDATVSDQVYEGQGKEDARAQALVERTRGWALTVGPDSRPVPVKAFYHSTCGGVTELPEHVWGAKFAGFRHAVRCPYCAGSPALNWRLELGRAEIASAFRRALVASEDARPAWAKGWPTGWRQAVAGGQLVGVRAGASNAESRVSEVITSWLATDARTGRRSRLELRVSGARFRDWVGPARFKSAAFQVVARGSLWLFEGRGNGHGVGMCQWGAKTMGERGFTTAAILKHYYPDAVLRKMW
jgi:stage II sporulation protein D